MKLSTKKLFLILPSIARGINRANKKAFFLSLVAMSSFSINSVSATSSEGCRILERIYRMCKNEIEAVGAVRMNSTFQDVADRGLFTSIVVVAAAGIIGTIIGLVAVVMAVGVAYIIGVPLAGGVPLAERVPPG